MEQLQALPWMLGMLSPSLGSPRFPLKGSFKGDIDIDIDVDVDIDVDMTLDAPWGLSKSA